MRVKKFQSTITWKLQPVALDNFFIDIHLPSLVSRQKLASTTDSVSLEGCSMYVPDGTKMRRIMRKFKQTMK